MAKRKPKLIRGRGRPSFTMKPGTPMPQEMHPAIRKAEREITKLKATQKTGLERIKTAATQRKAAEKTGQAVVKYTPPKTPKPVAPDPSPDKAAKPAKKYGRIGRSRVGRLLTGQTGKSIIAKAAGKGLLRRAAARVVGTGLRFAGPVGAAYGAVVGARDIAIAAKEGVVAVKERTKLKGMRKRSKAKYGTLEAAARTRKAMTGK